MAYIAFNKLRRFAVKKSKICYALLLLVMLCGFVGCGSKEIPTSVTDMSQSTLQSVEFTVCMDTFEEISYDQLNTTISNASGIDSSEKEVTFALGIWQYGLSSYPGIYLSYVHFNVPYEEDTYEPELASSYLNENGIDIRDIEQAHDEFARQYDRFDDYLEDNPNGILMEMKDDRGYIIFDIDDRETIYALRQGLETGDNTRYYGVIYHCDRCYLSAIFLSDSNENFDDFVNILDELGLPHM